MSDSTFIKVMSEHWEDMPDALITNHSSFERICNDVGIEYPPVERQGNIGDIFGIVIWIDERFDEPVFIGGRE